MVFFAATQSLTVAQINSVGFMSIWHGGSWRMDWWTVHVQLSLHQCDISSDVA